MEATSWRRAVPPLSALAFGGFSLGTTEFATMGLLPYIAEDLGRSIPEAGHTISAYALGVVVGAPVLSVLTARLDRRRLLVALMALFTAGHVFAVLSGGLEWLVVSRFLAGLPHGVFFGVGAVVGSSVAGPENRGRAISLMMAGLTVANVVGVPLATLIGHSLGWRAAYALIGALGLVTMALVWRLVPSGGGTGPGEGGARSLLNRPLWAAFVGIGVGFGGVFAVYAYVSPILTRVSGLPESRVPLVMALFGLGMTAGTLLGGRMADRHVIGAVYRGFVATMVVLALFGVLGSVPVAAIMLVVALGVTSQIMGVALQARLMDLSPSAPSLGAALSHSALNAGNANGALLGGLAIDLWGYRSTAWVGVVLAVVGMLVLVLAPSRTVQAASREPEYPEGRLVPIDGASLPGGARGAADTGVRDAHDAQEDP